MICPNINSPEFKYLQEALGTTGAYKVFISNNYNLPPLEDCKDIVSEIKEKIESLLPDSNNSLVSIAKKYNMDANNYVFNRNQSIYDINKDLRSLNINYFAQYIPDTNMIAMYEKLPNNSIKRLRPNLNIITNNPKTAKQAIINAKQEPLPSDIFAETLDYPVLDIDRTANVVIVDGEIRSYFDVFDELVPTAELPLIQTINSQLQILSTRRIKLLKDRRNTDNTEDLVEINKQLAAINAEVRTLEDRKKSLESLPKESGQITPIFKQADQDLNRASEILGKEEVGSSELKEARNLINLWVKATAIYDQDSNIIFDDAELQTEGIREKIVELADRVRILDKKLVERDRQSTLDFVNSTRNRKITLEELMMPQKDIAEVQKWLLNPSRTGNPILQSVYDTVTTANNNAYIESRDRWESIDEAFNEARKNMPVKDIFQLFRQQYKDGRYTNNMTFRFSQEYFDTKEQLLSEARRLSAVANSDQEIKNAKVAWKRYYNWAKDNQITFDARILFPDEREDDDVPEEFIYSRIQYDSSIRESHLEDLRKHLGNKGLDLYIETLKKRLEEFRDERKAVYFNLLDGNEELSEESKALFEIWLREHSPYWAMDLQANEAMRSFANKPLRKSFKYTVVIPRRTDTQGKDLGWYDSKFDKIESNEKLLNFYNTALDILLENKSIIGHRADHLSMNTLPYLGKNITEAFSDKSFSGVAAFKDTWERVLEMTRDTDSSVYDYETKNIRTGETQKEIQIPLLTSQEAQVNAELKVQLIKFKTDNPGVKITREVREDIRRKIVDSFVKESSFDLVKLLKVYSFQALAYKHKSFIEDSVDIATRVIQDIERVKTNTFGVAQKRIDTGNLATDGTLKNAADSLNNFLDNQYYGYKIKSKGKKWTKVLTPSEKQEKKELEDLLDKVTDTEEKEVIQKKLDNLGGYITTNTALETTVKYFYLTKLGWNVMASISNTLTGLTSNTILASDTREFKKNTLAKGYMMALNSIGSNYTFDLYKNISPTARKIRNLMDKYNVLNDASQELFKRGPESAFNKNLKRFMPFNLNTRAEYLNQAPLMIAYLLSQEVTKSDGTTTNLWNALDEEGNLKEGYSVQQIFLDKDGKYDAGKLMTRLESLIHEAHGDYKNTVQAQTKPIGRALLIFRRYLLEGFANRIQNEWYDPIRGYNRKGRYRTGVGIISAMKGTGLNAFNQLVFNSYQLLRKLTFQKTQYDQEGTFLGKEYKFSPADAANMRKNLTELVLVMSVLGATLALKSLKGEDDEDELWATNYLINFGNRLTTDLMVFVNPLEFEKLNKNSIPLFVLLADSRKWGDSVLRQLDSDEDNNTVRSGSFEGMNWTLRRTLEGIPITSQGMRLYSAGDKVLGEK